jgi:hypothetical protein
MLTPKEPHHAAFMLLQHNAANGRSRAAPSRKPDSGHADTISITIRVHRISWNAMNPGSSAY